MIRSKVWLSALLLLLASHTYSEEPKTTQIYGSAANYSNDISFSIGVQQALQQQGIVLERIDYGFDYRIGPNPTEGYCNNWVWVVCTDWRIRTLEDTYISGSTSFTDADGNVIASNRHEWRAETNWTSLNSTLQLPDNGVPYKDIGRLYFDYTLHDDVNLANVWANGIWIYDPCFLNPLSSPTCPGYAAAYAAQQLEEMTSQQEIEEPIIEVTPTQTVSSSTPDVFSGGTTDTGSSEPDPEPVSVQETADKDDDKKEKLALAKSLDAANNFDVSSVSSAPTADAGLDVAAAAEQQVMGESQQALGGTLDGSMDQTTSGLGGLLSDPASAEQNQQTSQTREEKQERRERLKEIVENRANEIAEENAEAESLDEQSQQQMEQLALMNYVPGFDTYGISLPGGVYPDAEFYKPTTVPESRRGLRNGLAQQILHEQMVQMQYERGQ